MIFELQNLINSATRGLIQKRQGSAQLHIFFTDILFLTKQTWVSYDIKYTINKRFLLRNGIFRYLRMQKSTLTCITVTGDFLKREAISCLFCSLLAFGTCLNSFRDPFMSGE